MKLNRVTQSDGKYFSPAMMNSLNPRLSRRGFVTAAGMGVGLVAMGPSLVREAKAAESGVKNPRKLKQIKTRQITFVLRFFLQLKFKMQT